MHINKNKEDIEGTILKYKGKQYRLTKEITPKACKGCDLINYLGCKDEITKYCRQGYILKRIVR